MIGSNELPHFDDQRILPPPFVCSEHAPFSTQHPPTPRHSTPLQTGTLRAPTANTPEALFELSVLAGQQLPQASRDLGALDAGEADPTDPSPCKSTKRRRRMCARLGAVRGQGGVLWMGG